MGSGPRVERARRREGRACEGWEEDVGWLRDTFEALRDGGPRKREGGGARWGWADPGVAAEVGDKVDIFKT